MLICIIKGRTNKNKMAKKSIDAILSFISGKYREFIIFLELIGLGD